MFPLALTGFERFMQVDDREFHPMTFVLELDFAGTLQKKHFEDAVSRVRPTVTPDMLEYYSKMEERLTSGLSNIKRSRDTGYGMESM